MVKCSHCGAPMGSEDICSVCGESQSSPSTSMEGKEKAPIEETGKEMGDDKTQKGIKSFTKMLKAMKISPQAIIIEKLMILLEPFLALLDLFNPLLEYLAGIFEQMLVPVIQAVLPIILLLMGYLDELKPIFMALGQMLGGYITQIVTALIPIFEAMADVVRPFIPLFKELTPLFDLAFELLFPFLPLLELLIPLIKMLIPVIWFVVHGIRDLISYAKMASSAIQNFVSWIKNVADIASSLSGGSKSKKSKKSSGFLGGIFGDEPSIITSPGVVRIGQGAVPEFMSPIKDLGGLGGNNNSLETLRLTEMSYEILTEIRDNTKPRRR